MKISVIIANMNNGRYIGEAISSIYRQNMDAKDYEIIVVDGGSSDTTLEVMKRYRGMQGFNFFRQNGKGISNACNEGIREAKGEYIIRLDADDMLYEDALREESAVLDSSPAIDFAYGDYIYHFQAENEYRLKRLPDFDYEELSSRGDFLSGGTMYRKSLFEKVGLYDETVPTIESYEFILRLVKNRVRGMHIRKPLFEYRIHGKSMSNNQKLVEKTGKEIAARYGMEYKSNINHPRFFKNATTCLKP